MTLDKAIEINKRRERQYLLRGQLDNACATNLGIEALNLYRHNRLIGQHVDPDSLPSETKE